MTTPFQPEARRLRLLPPPPVDAHPEDGEAADKPSPDDRPHPPGIAGEEIFFDELIEHQPERRGGDEGGDEMDGELPARGVAPLEPGEHLEDTPPVEPEHGDDRPGLDADGKGIRRVALRDAEDALGEQQMPGRADGQVF